MERLVGIDDLDTANHFLRALWAELRRACGKCAWIFAPFKNGPKQEIFFGIADIGRPEGEISITIRYQTKGSIKSIRFEFANGSDLALGSALGQLLDQSVAKAVKETKHMQRRFLQASVHSFHGAVAYYHGNSLRIQPVADRNFTLALAVFGYDDLDAQNVFSRNIRRMLDILSVETNGAFMLSEFPIDPVKLSEEEANAHYSSDDWIDGMPVYEGQCTLSRSGFEYINELSSREAILGDDATFLRACRLFHVGRKYDAQVNDRMVEAGRTTDGDVTSVAFEPRDIRLDAAAAMGSAQVELATTCYMSALEVASLIGAATVENCKHCGQPVYSIAKRVVELAEQHGGDEIKNFIKKDYVHRSKFLHVGAMLYDDSYIGTSLPQLDPDAETGCKVHTLPLPNIREFVSFCLRSKLRELAKVAMKQAAKAVTKKVAKKAAKKKVTREAVVKKATKAKKPTKRAKAAKK